MAICDAACISAKTLDHATVNVVFEQIDLLT